MISAPKALRRFCATAILCGLIAGSAFLTRNTFLKSAAKVLIINEPKEKVDATVILAGQFYTRNDVALEIYKNHTSGLFLVARPKPLPTDRIGVTQPERLRTEEVLIKNGVPAEYIREFGQDTSTDYDQAIALRAWLIENKSVRSILIPANIFSTRRISWLFKKILNPINVAVAVIPVGSPEYTADNWWRREPGIVDFQTEVTKLIYYHITH